LKSRHVFFEKIPNTRFLYGAGWVKETLAQTISPFIACQIGGCELSLLNENPSKMPCSDNELAMELEVVMY